MEWIQPIHTDVLVFAAHQDDDVLGLGATLYRHSLNGDRLKYVFATNGTAGGGESWYRKINKGGKKSRLTVWGGCTSLTTN